MKDAIKEAAKEAAKERVRELEERMTEELEEQGDKISRMESGMKSVKELQLLAQKGQKLIDVITKHVLEVGMSEKI